MTWKPTSNVVITAISIVPSFSDAETTELSGLISPQGKGRCIDGPSFFPAWFSVFSVFLSSYFILLHSFIPISCCCGKAQLKKSYFNTETWICGHCDFIWMRSFKPTGFGGVLCSQELHPGDQLLQVWGMKLSRKTVPTDFRKLSWLYEPTAALQFP